MFSRIAWDNFQLLFPIIGFFLIAGGFLYFLVRAIIMRKDRADYMSRLPLEEENRKPNKNDDREEEDPDSSPPSQDSERH